MANTKSRGASAKQTTPQQQKPAENGGQRPVHQIRLGRIVGSIWLRNDSNGRPFHTATIARIYKDDQGAWQRSDSFGRNDLPVVALVGQKAFEWMIENRPAEDGGE